MDLNLFLLPAGLGTFFSYLAVVIVGIFGSIYLFKFFFQKSQSDINSESQKLVELLEKRANALDKRVNELETLALESNNNISKLQERNDVIEKIFQGRDLGTIEYQKRGIQAIEEFEALKPIILGYSPTLVQIQKNIEGLQTNISSLIKTLDMHLQGTSS